MPFPNQAGPYYAFAIILSVIQCVTSFTLFVIALRPAKKENRVPLTGVQVFVDTELHNVVERILTFMIYNHVQKETITDYRVDYTKKEVVVHLKSPIRGSDIATINGQLEGHGYVLSIVDVAKAVAYSGEWANDPSPVNAFYSDFYITDHGARQPSSEQPIDATKTE